MLPGGRCRRSLLVGLSINVVRFVQILHAQHVLLVCPLVIVRERETFWGRFVVVRLVRPGVPYIRLDLDLSETA